MEYPKITIITPVYNQVKFIEKAVRSVVDQNYPNLEYIIVDGGSTDGTMEVINKYSDKITRIISEPDKGMYDALNKGFQLSTGEIMAYLNSDDMYHKGSLFIVAEIFQKFPEVEFMMGQKTSYDENDRGFITPLRQWSKYDFYIQKSHGGIQQESTFWRRSLWELAGGYINTNYKLAGDCELWTRFLVDGKAKIHMTNALIGGFRVRKDQLSTNSDLYSKEVMQIYNGIQKSEEEIKTLKKISFYKKYLTRIPVLRFVFPWNRNYEAFFNYPDIIKYNFRKNEFVKSKY